MNVPPPPPNSPPVSTGLRFAAPELEEARWLIGRAINEDLPAGDLTTDPLFEEDGQGGPHGGKCRTKVHAALVARTPGVLCGLPVIRELFQTVEAGKGERDWKDGNSVQLEEKLQDGDRLEAAVPFLYVVGPARTILRLERTALNFLQHLSGIATQTRRWVEAIAGTGARLFDTRKTTPGWRSLEKYAVRAGGGENHRKSLSDAILLKDNHVGILRSLGRGGLKDWVRVLRRSAPGAFLQVEVESREEFLSLLDLEVDSILLDNFPLADIRWAVETRDRKRLGSGGRGPVLEASGGMRLETVRLVAETGVERISAGALTHSSAALDMGLDLVRAWD